MDALTLLKQDHRTVEEIFARFEATSARAMKTRKLLVDKLIRELSVHAVIEEQLFYPALRARSAELSARALDFLEEHHVVKWTLDELDNLDAGDERFAAKVRLLMRNVQQHVKEEERLFALLRRELSREELAQMGEGLERAKKLAPTRPHPRAPDQPPGNLVAGVMAKVVDTGRDLARGRKTRRLEKAAARERRQPTEG